MVALRVFERRTLAWLWTAGLLTVPSVASADVTLTPSLGVVGSFTDNVRGANKGSDQEDSDLFTTISPGISINSQGGRVSSNLNYSLNYDKFKDATDLDTERHSLLGSTTAEVVRNAGFINAQASYSRQTINRGAADASGDRSLGANETDVFNYRLGPSWQMRFGNLVDSTTSYDFSQTLFDPLTDVDEAGANTTSDAYTHSFNQTFSSGSRFTRLRWSVAANYAQTVRADDDSDDPTTANLELDTEYALNRMFTALASVGYENIEDNSIEGGGFDEPIWSLGLRWQPGPRTDFSFNFGRRFEETNFSGDASFVLGGGLRFNAFYQQTLQIQQTTSNDAFDNLAVDEQGNFVDIRTGLPLDVNDPAFDLTESDNAFREDTFRASISGARGRNSYTFSGFFTERNTDATNRQESVLGYTMGFSRRLQPLLSLNLNGSATFTDDSIGADQRSYSAGASLNYTLGATLTGVLAYSGLYRFSDADGNDLRENQVSVSLRKSF